MKNSVKIDLSKFLKVFKYLLYLAEFVLFYVLENLPSGFPLIFSVKPMLVISLLVVISLLESEMSTVFFSLGAGLLLDAGVAPVGLSSLFLTICCTLLSALSKKKFHVRVLSNLVASFIVAFLYGVFIWSAVYLMQGSERAAVIFIDRFVPSIFYTVLVSPIVYILNICIFSAFKSKLSGK